MAEERGFDDYASLKANTSNPEIFLSRKSPKPPTLKTWELLAHHLRFSIPHFRPPRPLPVTVSQVRKHAHTMWKVIEAERGEIHLLPAQLGMGGNRCVSGLSICISNVFPHKYTAIHHSFSHILLKSNQVKWLSAWKGVFLVTIFQISGIVCIREWFWLFMYLISFSVPHRFFMRIKWVNIYKLLRIVPGPQ